jgi:aminoglycoside/choline kinase family phosphotransferase
MNMNQNKQSAPPQLMRLLQSEGLLGGEISVQPLSGDGSDRRFYRITGSDTSLLAALPGMPASFSGLAEARSAIKIGTHLRAKGIGVPEIIASDEEHGIIIFEDLGDTLLADAVDEFAHSDMSAVENLYFHIIDLLFKMQTSGCRGFDPDWCWDTPVYNQQLMLEKESGYFLRAFCRELLGIEDIDPRIDNEFQLLAGRAAEQPATFFLHRDFQSRNLMLHRGEIRIIDFQGGRLGPLGYDLASLLIDPYVPLTEIQRTAFLEKYVALLSSHGIDRHFFLKGYYCLALQRNLQILGAFSFLSQTKGKPFFADFILPAATSLHQLLAKDEGDDYPCLRSLINRCLDLLNSY